PPYPRWRRLLTPSTAIFQRSLTVTPSSTRQQTRKARSASSVNSSRSRPTSEIPIHAPCLEPTRIACNASAAPDVLETTLPRPKHGESRGAIDDVVARRTGTDRLKMTHLGAK